MMTIMLRKADISDLNKLATMNKQLIEDERSRNTMNMDQLQVRMRDWMTSDWEIDILCHSSDIVGYVLYQFHPYSNNLNPTDVYLRQYFIKREYRNQGYGRQGIELLLTERLQTVNTITIEVLETNPDGIRFWERVGFTSYSKAMKRYQN